MDPIKRLIYDILYSSAITFYLMAYILGIQGKISIAFIILIMAIFVTFIIIKMKRKEKEQCLKGF